MYPRPRLLDRKPTPYDEQALTDEVILCRCRAARMGLISPHRDWQAELNQARLNGRAPDESTFANVETDDSHLDPPEGA
jgi:hypothetical protein